MKFTFKKINRFRSCRLHSALIHDVVVACLAWILAFSLRFNFSIPSDFISSLTQVMYWAVPLQAIFFLQFGMYKGVWRFASLPDLQRIIAAIFTSAILIGSLLLIFRPVAVVPKSTVILDALILVLWLGGSRFFYRVWKDYKIYGRNRAKGKPVLLIGSGESAVAVVKELDSLLNKYRLALITLELFIFFAATITVWSGYEIISEQLASMESELVSIKHQVSALNKLDSSTIDSKYFSRGRELPIDAILGDRDYFLKWKNGFESWYGNQIRQITGFDIVEFNIIKEESYKGISLKTIRFGYTPESALFSKAAGGVLAIPENINKELPVIIAIHGHEFSPWGDYPRGLFIEEKWPYEMVKAGYVVWAPISMYHDEIKLSANQYGGFPLVWVKIVSNGLDHLKTYLSKYSNSGYGVAGLSAGGQIAYSLMAYRPDLRFGVFAGADQDLEFLRDEYRVKGHPDCWDISGVNSFTPFMTLLAPRPIQFQLGRGDPFFPNGKKMEKQGDWFTGTSRPQFSTEVGGNALSIRSIYEIYGAKNNFSYLIHNQGHDMMAIEALDFIRLRVK